MKLWSLVPILLLVLGLCVGCGPKPDAKTPGDGKGGKGSLQDDGGQGGGAPVTKVVSCATSDDCQEGQICVDEECAVPVPDGFY